jgi:hypothetical protein
MTLNWAIFALLHFSLIFRRMWGFVHLERRQEMSEAQNRLKEGL